MDVPAGALGKMEESGKGNCRRLEREILEFLERAGIRPGERLLAAYSGGTDSAALLFAVAALGLYRIRAVHVVHGLRPESELRREEEIVRANCRSLGVPLSVVRVKPGAIARISRERKCGIECAARLVRYRAIAEVARKHRCGTALTAHTADDNLETILDRVIGGSSLDGMGGIPGTRRLRGGLLLARPLLGVTRRETEEYVRSGNIPYSDDSTNADVSYRRNRIRATLVPLLDSGFPGWRKGLETTARNLSEDRGLLEGIVGEAFARCALDRKAGRARIPAAAFDGLPFHLKKKLLLAVAGNLSGKERISSKAAAAAVRQLGRGAKAADLPGMRVEAGGNCLEIVPLLDFRAEDGYFFLVPMPGKYACGSMSIEARMERMPQGEAAPDAGTGTACIFRGAFEFPLAVRGRQPGDVLETDGKTIRVDDILKSLRIPRDIRDLIPLVEDRRGIVAILPALLPGMEGFPARFREYRGGRDEALFISMKGVMDFHGRQ